jgi:hypothetical protein
MPENIATVMRLLTLDLEREIAAETRLPSPPSQPVAVVEASK